MSRSMCALLEQDAAAGVPLEEVVNAGRYRYTKGGHACLIYVIADIDRDGREDFTEQESGSLSWHPFTPSPAERQAMLAQVSPNSESWPRLRIDSPEGSR